MASWLYGLLIGIAIACLAFAIIIAIIGVVVIILQMT